MWRINKKSKGIAVSFGDTFVIPFSITNHVLTSSEKVTFTVRKYHMDKRTYKMVLGDVVFSKSFTKADAMDIKDQANQVVGSQICVVANKEDWGTLTAGDYDCKYDLVLQDTATNKQVAMILPTDFAIREVLL